MSCIIYQFEVDKRIKL